MYKIMVVDDEPHVVNWIYELLTEHPGCEAEVYKAYSAFDAIAYLEKASMDIVITDIHMPKMSGLELMEYILKHWADTRIIFLTGYDEFDYVYSAISNDGVSYILKTEDDDVLLAAVEQALLSIRNRNQAALTANRQESLLRLLRYRDLLAGFAAQKLTYEHMAEKLIDLAPGINLQADVALMVARLDALEGNRFDIYAGIELLMAETLCGQAVFLQADYNESVLLWITQGAEGAGAIPHAALVVQLQNASERICQACSHHWGVSISFAIAQQSVRWQCIPQKLAELLYDGILNAGADTGMVVVYDRDICLDDNALPYADYTGKIGILRNDLEQGRHDEYNAALGEITSKLAQYPDMRDPHAGEIYIHLASMLLSYINQNKLSDRLANGEGFGLLCGGAAFSSWREAAAYLARLSRDIIDLQRQEKQQKKNNLVYCIENYIENNLAGDLSLTAIGEALHYNSSYLSRMFKQTKGVNLLNFIVEKRLDKGARILAQSNEPVYAVGRSVGFDSPAYFAKVFRRVYGSTPQEYREGKVRF